jgi:hypothetical protein
LYANFLSKFKDSTGAAFFGEHNMPIIEHIVEEDEETNAGNVSIKDDLAEYILDYDSDDDDEEEPEEEDDNPGGVPMPTNQIGGDKIVPEVIDIDVDEGPPAKKPTPSDEVNE